MLKIKSKWGIWQNFWGVGPLPKGAEGICVIESEDDIGALIKLANGQYIQGNHGCIKQIDQKQAKLLDAAAES